MDNSSLGSAIDEIVQGPGKAHKATYSFDQSITDAAVQKAMAALGWNTGIAPVGIVNVPSAVTVLPTQVSAPSANNTVLLGASTPLDAPLDPAVPNPEPATVVYLLSGGALLLIGRTLRRSTT